MRLLTTLFVLAVSCLCVACSSDGRRSYGEWEKSYQAVPDMPRLAPTAEVDVRMVPPGIDHRDRIDTKNGKVHWSGESGFYTERAIERDNKQLHEFAKSLGADTALLTVELASERTTVNVWNPAPWGKVGRVSKWRVLASYWSHQAEAPPTP